MIKCNLAVLMAERKLSIQDVSERTGLSRTTISALVNENGKGIQFDTMDALCELLKVSPGALFSFASIKANFSIVIDDEGGNTQNDYALKIHAQINSDMSKFNDHIPAFLHITLNESSLITSQEFRLLSSEYNKFLSDLPFSQQEYIQELLEIEVQKFVAGLPDVKGFASFVITIKWDYA